MGYNAFDIDLGDFIDADLAVKKEKGKYLCPYEKCHENKVPVFLKEGQHGCFFSSYSVDQHCDGCTFVSDTKNGEDYRHKNYGDFSMDNLVSGLRSWLNRPNIKKTVHKKRMRNSITMTYQ